MLSVCHSGTFLGIIHFHVYFGHVSSALVSSEFQLALNLVIVFLFRKYPRQLHSRGWGTEARKIGVISKCASLMDN